MKWRLLVVVAALALVVAPAAAAATLTVDPDPVARGGTFTLSGCGYPAVTGISFEVVGPRKSGIDYFTSAEPTDAGGCYAADWIAWWSVAGEYQITSYFVDSKGARKKGAVVKFTVT